MPAALLTVAEVAERLQLGRSTVYRLAKDGDLEAVQIGRAVRFEPEAVDAFIASRRTGPERGALAVVGGTRGGTG